MLSHKISKIEYLRLAENASVASFDIDKRKGSAEEKGVINERNRLIIDLFDA